MSDQKEHIDSNWIKARAGELGFPLVGITTPEPPPHFDIYQAWIESGRHAAMGYLSRAEAMAKRGDPRLVFAACQSIIVTGTFYGSSNETDHSEFLVAGYAVGDDYHNVLIIRLEKLVSVIEQALGEPVKHRIYTDTGPLLERELGQRAGLGWIGKNTCLIHPTKGSYFLLAELMLDLPLEPDPPFTVDRCGSCRRCIDACPTGCILPDRTIEADRCISYLTIENKDDIQTDIRTKIGDWLFGCDICQQVCPWNVRFGSQESDPAFKPRPIIRKAELKDFLSLNPESWQKHLEGSPLVRAKRKGLVRNASIVAGNRADETLIDDLAHVLQSDPDPLPRSHAAWALKQLEHPRAKEIVKDQLLTEPDPAVRQALQED